MRYLHGLKYIELKVITHKTTEQIDFYIECTLYLQNWSLAR